MIASRPQRCTIRNDIDSEFFSYFFAAPSVVPNHLGGADRLIGVVIGKDEDDVRPLAGSGEAGASGGEEREQKRDGEFHAKKIKPVSRT